ncbi:hypothetical protein BgiBS90_032479 [Biomphalaria glabrata]|nr:hypothetical protein BgiBS90_032479 [Biomphalaria glabrata]KAI8753606.1 hypothetical protein BgiMline_014161 [Biomphalaria glabrata]
MSFVLIVCQLLLTSANLRWGKSQPERPNKTSCEAETLRQVKATGDLCSLVLCAAFDTIKSVVRRTKRDWVEKTLIEISPGDIK